MTLLKSRFRSFVAEVTEVPEFFKQKKFPSIDGFRAVSIILVLGFHMGRTDNAVYQMIFNGSLGVNVFFVISGFLITSLLLKENVLNGTISLKDFYIRRILRIFPVAWLYLLVIVALNYILQLHISAIYLGAAFLYIINFKFFDPYKSSLVSHYWSLSVEEQFYVIFPFILKKSFKIFLFFILFIVFVLPFFIFLEVKMPALNNGPVFIVTHYLIKFQSIAVGCLFAILVFKNKINFKAMRSIQGILKIACVVIIFSLNHTGALNQYSVFSNLMISISTALLITLNLFFAKDWMYKFLNLKWMVKIGMLSYSIYIWHLLFLNADIFPEWFINSPVSLIFILIISFLSYEYWEKLFLKLKKRVTPVIRRSYKNAKNQLVG